VELYGDPKAWARKGRAECGGIGQVLQRSGMSDQQLKDEVLTLLFAFSFRSPSGRPGQLPLGEFLVAGWIRASHPG
jgi:hypothetical protein